MKKIIATGFMILCSLNSYAMDAGADSTSFSSDVNDLISKNLINTTNNGEANWPFKSGSCEPTVNGQTYETPYGIAGVSFLKGSIYNSGCNAGAVIGISINSNLPPSTITWQCLGTGGATNASCSANVVDTSNNTLPTVPKYPNKTYQKSFKMSHPEWCTGAYGMNVNFKAVVSGSTVNVYDYGYGYPWSNFCTITNAANPAICYGTNDAGAQVLFQIDLNSGSMTATEITKPPCNSGNNGH